MLPEHGQTTEDLHIETMETRMPIQHSFAYLAQDFHILQIMSPGMCQNHTHTPTVAIVFIHDLCKHHSLCVAIHKRSLGKLIHHLEFKEAYC